MNSFVEIIDFAIENEQSAYVFYTKMADQAVNKDVLEVFSRLAKEEDGHKEKLIEIKERGKFEHYNEMIPESTFDEYLSKDAFNPDKELTYKDALLIAIEKERVAIKLYAMLARTTTNENLKVVFESLSLEETKHKLQIEKEYENFVSNNN